MSWGWEAHRSQAETIEADILKDSDMIFRTSRLVFLEGPAESGGFVGSGFALHGSNSSL